jgi:hypothetical protein
VPKKRQGAGGYPAKPRNNFQPIAPERAWHPKVGAPAGNRNAQTHGGNSKELRAVKARARAAIRHANALIAAVRAARKRRLADLPPAP